MAIVSKHGIASEDSIVDSRSRMELNSLDFIESNARFPRASTTNFDKNTRHYFSNVPHDNKENLKPAATVYGSSSRGASESQKGNSAESQTPKNGWNPNRNTVVRGKPSACVFVASLPALLLDDRLCRLVSDHFKKFGDVSSVKVLRDPINRPYAFVQYTNDEDCKTAIALGHDSELGGRQLRCEPAKVNRTLFLSFSELVDKKLVSEITSSFGETELVLIGTNLGRVASDSLLLMSHNWFVKFTYRDEAIQAFASLLERETLQVEWAQNVDDIAPSRNLDRRSIFVGQLPGDIGTLQLREHFSGHGKIEDIQIVHKLDHSYAFITFAEDFAAASAVAQESHLLFMDRTIQVKYKYSAPKKMRRVYLSPRVPVALAPPPVNPRNRFSEAFSKSDWREEAAAPRARRSEFSARKGDLGKLKLDNHRSTDFGSDSEMDRYYLVSDVK
ncbi:hypothetical protein PUMCH_005196 [Australozyma saopauloensis]|uniref:RRM domain-containing protein n=1 Tax=Australozyma saopauloensis TaxID=291208 RepID=A0AAX4HIN5_9ASCO|nr:hypothetical protein PUMCH_005196 [[Candida] saopauloensis]